MDHQALQLSDCLGTSFTCIEDYGLREALSMASTVTVALDQYNRKGPDSPSIWDLARARNVTQWLLCCLKQSSSYELSTHSGLHNACRLATLIYSDIILFPIPISNTIKVRLAGDLRTALDSYKLLRNQDCKCTDLLTWMVVMGGIAAISTIHRHWYVGLLSLRLAAGPSTWDHFKALLSRFLWWQYVLDLPGRSLWDEAMSLREL